MCSRLPGEKKRFILADQHQRNKASQIASVERDDLIVWARKKGDEEVTTAMPGKKKKGRDHFQ